jgi:hypothetical protein
VIAGTHEKRKAHPVPQHCWDSFSRLVFRDAISGIAGLRSLAWKGLVVSFAPDVIVALRRSWGGGWPEALALMTMHIAVWALCISMLPSLARGRRKRIPAAV